MARRLQRIVQRKAGIKAPMREKQPEPPPDLTEALERALQELRS